MNKRRCLLDAGKKTEVSFCSPFCPAYRSKGNCLYLQALKFILDESKLKGTQIGESKSFEELIIENYEKLRSYCRKLAKDFYLGEDICQEVLKKAIENKDNFKPDQPILPWLLKTAKNIFIDYYRKERSSKVELVDATEFVAVEQSFEKFNNLEVVSMFALAALTEQQRKALELVYIEGKEYSEASREMGLSYKGFYSLLKRAEKKLREEIKDFL